MRKLVFLFTILLIACSKSEDSISDFRAPDYVERYFTITNGDSKYSLDIGIGVLQPGSVSDIFTIGGDSAEVRCWWLVDGESIYSPLRVNMKGKPNKTTENYTLTYEHSDN